MNETDLIERACETIAGFLALGNERFEAHGASFVRNLSVPGRHDANHVGLIRTRDAGELEALLRRAEVEFAGVRHRRFDVDPLTPPQVAARLALDNPLLAAADARPWPDLLWLLLEGDLKAEPPPVDIREALSEDDWLDYRRLDRMWWEETGVPFIGPYDPAMHDEFIASKRGKCPAVRFWLAWVEGVAVSFLCSWPGDNGIGMVEDLYTDTAYRHRGIATALLAHGVRDARERGAGPVIIGAVEDDTPKQMYADLGFRPLLLTKTYVRLAQPST